MDSLVHRRLNTKGGSGMEKLHADYALEMKERKKCQNYGVHILSSVCSNFISWSCTYKTKRRFFIQCSQKSSIMTRWQLAIFLLSVHSEKISLISSVVCHVKSYIYTVYVLKLSMFAPSPKKNISCFLVENSWGPGFPPIASIVRLLVAFHGI